MGIGDIFKANENKELKAEIERLNNLLTPEMQNALNLQKRLEELQNKISESEQYEKSCKDQISKLDREIREKQSQIIQLNSDVIVQSFGLYEPQFDFCNAEEYKNALDQIRKKEKEAIKDNLAVTGATNWNVNGSASQGQKMVKDMQKLLLRAFNVECDELVAKVKYNNYETYKKRIETSCDAISKLGKIMNVSITSTYKKLKIDELTLAFEYAQMKQKEKEEQKALREQMREEAKLQKEIEEQRKTLEKEQNHYANALSKVNAQLLADPNNADLLAKKQELEKQAEEIEKAIQDVDYRQANKRAGYVYVISNIGAFGENVYKIGMTRRLDPMDRVDELGDASVPFNFDVHAMIFTDDAPALEAALHKAFEDRKLNMVNQRREFFYVSLNEIKDVIKKNYDKTVEWIDVPDAEQYRVSQKMRKGELPRNVTAQRSAPVVPNEALPQPSRSVVQEPRAEVQPQNFESVSEKIKSYVTSCGYTLQIEDNPELERLHIYSSENKKMGTVKINKNDLSMQYRDLSQGTVTSHDLQSAENIKDYLKKA